MEDSISLVTAGEALAHLCGWVRAERQRVRWTQSELARRSGVPAATISRLELTYSEGPNGWQTLSVAGEGQNPTQNDLDRLAKDVGLIF